MKPTVLFLCNCEDSTEAEGSEEEQIEVFRRVRDQIHARIQLWLEEIES